MIRVVMYGMGGFGRAKCKRGGEVGGVGCTKKA